MAGGIQIRTKGKLPDANTPWGVLPKDTDESYFSEVFKNIIESYLPTNSIYWMSILRRALFQRVLGVFKSSRRHSLTLKNFE